MLLPTNLPRTLGSIDKLEQLAASSGATSFAIGRFLGPGGRYAILLAPAAQVSLRNLEVRSIAPLFAEAIGRIHRGESISSLLSDTVTHG